MTREATDGLRRAGRTALQLIAGGGLTELTEEVVGGLDGTARALAVLGFAFVVSWAQNELEDHDVIPALFKAPASDGANPVPDPDTIPGDH